MRRKTSISRVPCLAPNGYKWLQMAPNSSKWLEITPNGLKWLQMAPIVVNHCKKALKGSKKVPKRAKSKGKKRRKKLCFPVCLQMTQNYSRRLQMNPNGFKWLTMTPNGLKWLKKMLHHSKKNAKTCQKVNKNTLFKELKVQQQNVPSHQKK